MSKTIEIPQDIWRELKKKSAEQDRPMKEITKEILKEKLEK